jgi:uncharacterized protein YjbI with pentapeptide repeats
MVSTNLRRAVHRVRGDGQPPGSCLATGLKNGTKYTVIVRATNSVGTGKAARVKMVVPNTTKNCSYVGAYGNLQSCNLSANDYPGVNLTKADLDGTSFYGDSLNGANLTDANAEGADLYHVDLTNAILTDANLTDADLNGATLTGATLTGTNLTNDMAAGYGNNLDVLQQGTITGTPIDLPSGWVFTEGYLLGPGIAPQGPDGYGANLTGGELAGVDLTDANLTLAYLSDADLTDANLTDADIYGTTFSAGTTVTGVIWSNTTCPDGTNSDAYSPQTCLNDGA